MIISCRTEGNKSVSLSIGKMDVKTGYIQFSVTVSIPGHYNRLDFSTFKTATDIYKDMCLQYFD